MKTALLFLSCFFLATSWAQFTLEAEIRPRLEYRHGFKTLYKASDSPALFISQRSRLNAKHVTEALTVYLSLQNIRVWGDVSQLNLADKNGNVIHQAWAELKFSPTGGIRLGRQELVYDDSRILGNVNWVQQARSHDAAVLRWKGINHQLHLGFAYNQEKENLVGNIYTLKGNYKAIQFLWYHKEGKNLSWSGLFLNNGLQYLGTGTKTKNQILYSQTAGINGTFRQNKLSLFGEGYYQFGKDGVNNQLNAALLGLELKYQWEPNFSTLLGYEYISGNDNGAPKNGKNKAFTPFYGTNHKFNGLMDYFYVGNHLNAVGLSDLYLSLNIKSKSKATYRFDLHHFAADKDIAEASDKNFGLEWDAIYSRSISPNVGLAVGYSHFFPTKTLKTYKQITSNETNNWFWLMLTVKPKLFVHNP